MHCDIQTKLGFDSIVIKSCLLQFSINFRNIYFSEIGTTNNPVITETQYKEGSGGGGGAGGTWSTESVERGGGPGHHIVDDTILFTIRLY